MQLCHSDDLFGAIIWCFSACFKNYDFCNSSRFDFELFRRCRQWNYGRCLQPWRRVTCWSTITVSVAVYLTLITGSTLVSQCFVSCWEVRMHSLWKTGSGSWVMKHDTGRGYACIMRFANMLPYSNTVLFAAKWAHFPLVHIQWRKRWKKGLYCCWYCYAVD